MFDIFGKFDSVEELNMCAAGLKAEGDTENLKTLAKENGIYKFQVEEYISGLSGELTDLMNAALGRIDIEGAEYKNNQVPVQPIMDYLKSQCVEEAFATCALKKTKEISECMKKIENECKKIQKETGKNYVADMTVFNWAKEYYMEG
jgi:hypothetical protein